jgi:hypothetical protein
MRSLARPRRLIVLALLFAALGAGLAYGSWIAAQLRAVVVLSTTLETPVLTWVVKHLTDEPRVEDARVAGEPSTVARPGGGEGPWPAIVVVNGATPLGRREPDVEGEPGAAVNMVIQPTNDLETAERWRAELAAGRLPQDRGGPALKTMHLSFDPIKSDAPGAMGRVSGRMSQKAERATGAGA